MIKNQKDLDMDALMEIWKDLDEDAQDASIENQKNSEEDIQTEY